MKTRLQAIIGALAVIGWIAVHEFAPPRASTSILGAYALALAAVIGGRRLPLSLRIVATGTIAYLGYGMCLLGRTMEPHLTIHNAAMALICFACGAFLPTLALLRAWQGRLRVAVVTGMLPFCLAAAFGVAAFEEYTFVRQHPHGAGPTPRWTVSMHWLAYDADRRALSGSD